jgi:hypothetical protein
VGVQEEENWKISQKNFPEEETTEHRVGMCWIFLFVFFLTFSPFKKMFINYKSNSCSLKKILWNLVIYIKKFLLTNHS